LRLVWESDSGAAAGVDLPAGFAFARAPGTEPIPSLLMGQNGRSWTNRFPMPYRRQAFLRVDSERPIKGTIRVRAVHGVPPDAGYFRASCHQVIAEPSKAAVELFQLSGNGHYAGTLVFVRGPLPRSSLAGGDRRTTVAARVEIQGVGTELQLGQSRYQSAGWNGPIEGIRFDATGASSARAIAYRWRVADPIPLIRSIRGTIERTDAEPIAVAYQAAVFWYSERPGPEPAGS
jgi:hypothetical protein